MSRSPDLEPRFRSRWMYPHRPRGCSRHPRRPSVHARGPFAHPGEARARQLNPAARRRFGGGRIDHVGPAQCRLHRDPHGRRGRGIQQGRRPSARHPGHGDRPEAGGGALRRHATDPGHGGRAGHVHQPDRRRRRADPLPRVRRRRRHGSPVRRTRARSARGGAPAAVPAVTWDDPGHLVGWPDGRARPADRRRVQPQGRRRDHDDRDEHRRRRRDPAARPGRDRRPLPPVRRGRQSSQPAREADDRRRGARRDRDARVRDHEDLRDASPVRAPRAGGAGVARGRGDS